MKAKTVLFAVSFLLLAAVRLHAQIDGCADSPENPTLVLGLIVSAGGFGFAQVRRYVSGRRAGRNK
ncbi:MAG: PExPT-CTERM protein [Acidobacteriota bacterium]